MAYSSEKFRESLGAEQKTESSKSTQAAASNGDGSVSERFRESMGISMAPAKTWADSYNGIIQKYNSYNTQRNGSWTKDVTGGTLSGMKSLIDRYATDAHDNGSFGGAYQQLVDLYNSSVRQNEFMSQFKDADHYDAYRSNYFGNIEGYDPTAFGLADGQDMEMRQRLHESNQAKLDEMQPGLLDAKRRYLAAQSAFEAVTKFGSTDVNDLQLAQEYPALQEEYQRIQSEADYYAGANQAYTDSGMERSDGTWQIRQTDAWKNTDTTYRGPTASYIIGENMERQQQVDLTGVDPGSQAAPIRDKLGIWMNASEEERKMLTDAGVWSTIAREAADNDWGMLNQNEIQTYYYLLNNSGEESANSYLDSMARTLNYRANQEQIAGIQKITDGRPVAAALLSLASTLPSVFGSLTSAGDTAGKLARGEDLNEYAHGLDFSRTASNIRAVVGNNLNQWASEKYGDALGKYAANTYQAIMSGIDSAVGAKIFGASMKFSPDDVLDDGIVNAISKATGGRIALSAGKPIGEGAAAILNQIAPNLTGYTGVMAGGAFSNRAIELAKSGASEGQIWMGALGAGAIEAFTENAGIDNIVNRFGKERFITEMLRNTASEAMEEGLSDVLNLAWDAMVRGESSDHSREIHQLMYEQGMSYDEARVQAAKDAAVDLFWSMYGGAISGGAMTAGAGALGGSLNGLANMVDNYGTGQDILNSGTQGQLMEQARGLTDAKKSAKLQKQAGKVSGLALDEDGKAGFFDSMKTGKVANQIRQQAANEYADSEKKTFREAAKKYIDASDIRNKSLALDTVMRMQFDETLLPGQRGYFRQIGGQKLIDAIVSKAGGQEAINRDAGIIRERSERTFDNVGSIQRGVDIDRLTNDHAYASENTGVPIVKETKEPVEIRGISQVAGGKMYLDTDQGTIEAGDISYGNDGQALMYSVVSSIAQNTTQANEIMGAFEASDMDSATFARAARNAFLQGRNGVAFDSIKSYSFAAKLDNDIRRQIWEAGAKSKQQTVRGKQAALDKGRHGKAKGGLKYDGFDPNTANLNEKQKAALDAANVLAVFGMDITVYASTEAQRAAGIPNGEYNTETGALRFDINSGMDGSGMAAFTLAHEFTHHIQEFAPQEFEKFTSILFAKTGVDAASLLEQKEAMLRNDPANAKKTDQEISDLAYAEAVAEACETMFTDTDVIAKISNQLQQQDKSLWDKIADWLRGLVDRLRNAYKGVDPDSDIAKQMRPILQQNEALLDAYVNAAVTAVEQYATLSPTEDATVYDSNGEIVAHSTADGSVQLSMRTYEESGKKAFREYLNKTVKSGKLTETEANEMANSIEDIYQICKEFKDKYAPFSSWSDAEVVRDTYGRPVFSVVTPNGDYKMNLDFSLVCKKRRTLDAVFNEMSRRGIIDDFELGQKSVVKINEIIRKHGFETACALCFVDAKRFRQAQMADSFTSLYNELVYSLVPDDQAGNINHFNFAGYSTIGSSEGGIETWDNSQLDFSHLDEVMRNYGKGTVEHKAAKYIKANPEARKLLLRGDFMSSAGFDAVKSQNKSILSLYNSKKGTGGPKAAFGDVQYMNEIISKARTWTPGKAYAVGGVRVQSFSDYVPRMVFDYVQMIHDLAATDLPAHAYSKEALFVKQFGLTGIKINMSLIPAVDPNGVAPGLDANGDYKWAGESFDFETAKAIQNADGYSENCGTICVGVSNEHIRKLLADPDIRMVIPYHKSGLNPIVAHMNKIAAFTDYTNVQNTRDADGKRVAKDFDFNKAMHDMGDNADPKSVVDQYLAWCAKNKYTPKFDEFMNDPNYYKLLEDFTLYDKAGEYVPQRGVRAVFPTAESAFGSMKDLIQQGLEEDAVIEGRRDSELGSIVDEIQNTLPKTEAEIEEAEVQQAETDLEAEQKNIAPDGTMYSLRSFEDGRRFVDVNMDTSVFDGMDIQQRNQTAKEIIRSKFLRKVVGIDNQVFVNGESINEYIHPSKDLDEGTRSIKLIAGSELDNLIDAGIPLPDENDGRDGHVHKGVKNFSYYETIFKVGGEYFSGKVNVMNIERGRLLKDITQIRNITEDISSSYGSNPKSTFLRDASMGTVPQKDPAVNNESMKSSRSNTYDFDVDDWLEALDIDDLIADLEDEVNTSAPRKARAKARVDEVNKVLKKWGLEFNGTKKAALTTSRIDEMLKPQNYGAGDNYSQGYITYMSPMDFLRLTAGGNTATTDDIEARANSHDNLDLTGIKANNPIYLDISVTSKGHAAVTDHDGRARMLQLGRAGFDQVPVIMFETGASHYGRQTEYGMKLKPQSFFNGSFISDTRSVTTDVMVPFSKGNRNLIINTFGEGSGADVLYSTRMSAETKAAIEAYKAQTDAVSKAQKAIYEAERKQILREYKAKTKALEASYSAEIEDIQNAFLSVVRNYEAKTLEAGAQAEMIDELTEALRQEVAAHDVDKETWDKEFSRLLKEYNSLKGKSETAVKDLEQKLQQQRETARARVESRHKTEMRHKIQDTVDTLNRYLLHPTKDIHVPESMQASVKMAMQAINGAMMSGKSAANAQRLAAYHAQLAQLEQNYEKNQAKIAEINGKIQRLTSADAKMKDALGRLQQEYRNMTDSGEFLFDDVIAEKIEEAFDAIGETEYNNLSMQQLEAVHDAYKAILTQIRNRNKSFRAGAKQTIDQMYSSYRREMLEKPQQGKFTSASGKMRSQFLWNNLKPVYAFDRIGSKTLSSLYNELRKGEDTWYRNVSDAKSYFMGTAAKYGYDTWDMNQMFDFESTTGEKFQLNLSEVMSLYAYSLRPQARGHLNNGGIVLNENTERTTTGFLGMKRNTIYNDANAYNLSNETIDSISGMLTVEQRAFAREMQRYLSDVMGAKGNEVSMQLYDIKLYKEQFYWPLKSSGRFSERAKESQQNPMNKIKNSGFTKATVQNASNPVELSGFMETWTEHVNKMSMYHAFTLPMEDFYRVYNHRSSYAEGTKAESAQVLLENACGAGAVRYIDQFLMDLNGGLRADPRETVEKALVSKFKKGAVFASASVAIQQPSAVGRAFSVISPAYFVGGRIENEGKAWEQLKKYAPVAGLKEMGRFDMDMGKSTEEYIMGGNHGFLDKVDNVLGWAPEKADEITWVAIWEAAKRQTAAHHPGIKGEELLQKAGDLFTECITRTQVYDSVFSRSANMRSKSGLMSMVTAFMAEPTTSANMIENAIRQWSRGDKRGASKAVASVLTSITINSLLAALVYAARDDDEDKTYLEKYAGEFVSGMTSGLNPITYIPLAKDIWSLFQGYDVDRADMALYADAASAMTRAQNVAKKYRNDFTDEEMQAWLKEVRDAGFRSLDAVAAFAGLPVKNVRRDINAVINMFQKSNWAESSGLTVWNAAKESFMEEIPVLNKMSNESKTDKLYNAILSGDRVSISRAKSRFADAQKLDTAMVTALKDNDPRIMQAARSMVDGDNATRIAISRQIIAEGNFSQNQVIRAINSEVSKLTSTSKDYIEKEQSLYEASDYIKAVTAGIGSADAMEQEMIRARVENKMRNGETDRAKATEAAESSFRSSIKQEVNDAFADGSLSAKDAKRVLVKAGIYNEEEAAKKVTAWSVLHETGDRYEWSDTRCLQYHDTMQPAGITAAQWDQFVQGYKNVHGEDKNGDGKTDAYSKMYAFIAFIDSLPLTPAQKDLLLATEYDSKKALKARPWR